MSASWGIFRSRHDLITVKFFRGGGCWPRQVDGGLSEPLYPDRIKLSAEDDTPEFRRSSTTNPDASYLSRHHCGANDKFEEHRHALRDSRLPEVQYG